MRRLVTALLIGLAAGPAPAQIRSAMPRMTCADAMDLVKRGGEVVVALGGPKPERIVRDRSFCDFSEIAELRFVPTRDNPECPIGYRCREPGFEEWNW
ncbi:hypothetical protein [uncultured Methylobacterium sp.]|uniref:hypothetical protein n=1 Tax=uncultured Methylobacterium sp. TaxID=157278 RepID=UPI0035C9EE95